MFQGVFARMRHKYITIVERARSRVWAGMFMLLFLMSSRSESLKLFDCRWGIMHDIVSSKKMENGIVVFWTDESGKKNDSFNYSELIDLKINALDLLDHPKSYKIDVAGRKLISIK